VRDEGLAVRRAVGRVSRPSRLRELRIGLDDPCSVAGLAREGAVAVFRPAAFAMDYRVAALTSGFPEASGLVIPVEAGGALRMVLYACAPRATDSMQPCGLERLQRELSEALARLEPDEGESTDYCYLEVG
jgi:hypothetical protein